MNKCIFYGVLNEDPSYDEDLKMVTLYIAVETYRKSKTADRLKEKCIVACNAWDTAAEILKNCEAGDSILVDCKYRNKAPFRSN